MSQALVLSLAAQRVARPFVRSAAVRCEPMARRRIPSTRTCLQCGVGVVYISRPSAPGLYCSKTCAGKAVGLLRISRGKLRTHVCKTCGVSKSTYYDNRKYCSKVCAAADPELTLARGASMARHYMRHGSRKDANHKEICDEFKRLGGEVLDLSRLGGGCPDIALWARGAWHVVEIKNTKTGYGRKGLNKLQQLWANAAQAPVYIIYTVEQAAAFMVGNLDGIKNVSGYTPREGE